MRNIYIICMLLLSYSIATAQLTKGMIDESNIQKELPKLLDKPNITGPTSVGKDFWFSVPPPLTQESVGAANFTRIFVVASGDATVRCSQPSGVDQTMFVPAGAVRSFDLKPGECQPYMHNYSVSVYGNPAQIYPGKGINITSDQPIVVYVVVRYAYTSDGYLALPTQGLGTTYCASVYDAREFGAGSLPNMLTLVAAYDRTRVKITVGGGLIPANIDILGGKRISNGESHEWLFNKGDVIVMSNVYADETLSGSLLEADKPFACISGQFCTDIPLRVRACDYTVEMDLPIQTWGQLYNIPWIRNRLKPSLLRVFAKEPNTTVWRDGQELFYFTQGVGAAGGTQNNAWIEERVWPVGTNPGVAIYTADNPIYVCLYNPSQGDDGVKNDPFSMIVTPIEQYQNEIVFSTPCADGGLNFTNNYLNIVFETDTNNLVPEDMEFGPVQSDGTVLWQKVRTLFGGSADLYSKIGIRGDEDVFKDSKDYKKQYAEKNITLPADGAFAIRSKNRFTCYSYGFADYDSYGYPTSTALRVVSKDTVAPKIKWTMDCQGFVKGLTIDNPDPDTNKVRVGLSIPELQWDDIINFTGFEYDNNNFVPGNPQTKWSIRVDDIKKYAKVILVFYDRSGNVTRDTIEYFPELIELREVASEDTNGDLFLEPIGVVGLNTTHTRKYEIENMSDSRTFTLKDVKLKNKTQGFTILRPFSWNEKKVFAPREKQEFTISFTTATDGRFFDSVGVSTDCQDNFYAKISAETGAPGITVNDHSFQPAYALSVDGNNPAIQSTVLKVKNECDGNPGNQPLKIIGYIEPTLMEFTHNLPLIDIANPVILNSGEELSFRVSFQPTSIGNYTDKIVFLTETDLGCDPECLIDAKAIQAGILTQEYDFEKQRINYPKQPNNQYEPLASEIITAINTTSGDLANELSITKIVFEPVKGPAGTNDGLNAFSFEKSFATTLPSNTMNFFKGIKIPAGGKSAQRKVYFKPFAVGEYEINYYFESNSEIKGKEIRYSIKGHAVVPNMFLYYLDNTVEETNLVNFGTITAGVPTEKVTRTLTIKNEPNNNADGEEVTITNINWGARATTVLADLGNANKEFFVDEAKMYADLGLAVGDEIKLGVGKSIDFDVTYYTTQANQTHSTDITIDSDADESGVTGKFNNTITLTGDALRPGLKGFTDILYSCLSNPEVVKEGYINSRSGKSYDNCFYYLNTGSKDVMVKSISFNRQSNNADPNFIKVDGGQVIKADGTKGTIFTPIKDVVLSKGDKLVVLLTYTPTTTNTYDIIMSAETDIATVDDQPKDETFKVESGYYERGTTHLIEDSDGNIINNNGNALSKIDFGLGEQRNLTYKFSLNDITPPTDLKDANLQEIRVEVRFRSGFLRYNPAIGVKLLGDYVDPSKFIISGPVSYENYETNPDITRRNKLTVYQTIRFKIVALGNNIINNGGELFSIDFTTGLTNFSVNGINGKTAEELYVEGRDDVNDVGSYLEPLDANISTTLISGNACGLINNPNTQVTLALSKTCAMGLRPLVISDFTNTAPGLISPHPVTANGSNIDFSIAFDSETMIRIVDIKGETVAILKDEKMKAGKYSLPIPVEKLSNGVYFYEISSEHLNSKDKFTVQK